MRVWKCCTALCLVLLALFVLPATATAASPWWQVSTSSRPTNLWTPKSEVQEVSKTSVGLTLIYLEEALVACMGGPECTTEYSLPNDETAVQLQTSLEAAYGAGQVEVAEETSGRFIVKAIGAAAGHYVAPLSATWVSNPGGERAKVLVEGGSGRLVVTLTNLGDAPVEATGSPLQISDQMPAGVSAYHVEAYAGLNDIYGPVDCGAASTSEITCAFEGELPPYEAIELEIYVSLDGEPPVAGTLGEVSVSGANAPAAGTAQSIHVSSEPTPFGIESYSVEAEEEGGKPATQAGSHPFQLTTTMTLNQGSLTPGKRRNAHEQQPAQPRNFRFTMPAGLVGDATVLPKCSLADFTNQSGFVNRCPDEAAIGAASVTIIETSSGFMRVAVPVFNLEPAPGEPARFGFMAVGVPVTLDAGVKSSDGYRITVHADNTSQLAQVLASTVTIWGVPGDPRHDISRGWNCVYGAPSGPCTTPAGLGEAPFLRLPTSCGNPLSFATELEPWNTPLGSDVVSEKFSSGPMSGCDSVPFEPSLTTHLDTGSADSPAGLFLNLHVSQEEAGQVPDSIAPSDVRAAKVVLPPGLQVNAAAANGLLACSEAQVGFQRLEPSGEAIFDDAPAACPEASKLGTAKITTPLLEEPLEGAVYQAAQGSNPFGSLLAIYIVAEAPGEGVRVKLASKVEPTSEGLVSTVEESPQMPFEDFELDFFGGPGAALATSGCGSYVTKSQIAPWSGSPAANLSSEFPVDSGLGGGACQSPEPFKPDFAAWGETPVAGAFSPFLLRLARPDGTQQVRRLQTTLPPGLLGRLAGVPYCPEAAISHAASLTGPGDGAREAAEPSCPAASQVGEVRVSSGVGPAPSVVGGKVYLAGPYEGAPLSLVTVTPAIAGPFDLGAVVVRVALEVDPETTQITAKSDPFPSELQGIPLQIRTIALKMDRPKFTVNPTSCEPMAVGATATSLLGQDVGLTAPFQVGDCKALKFSPRLSLRFKGSTRRNGHPQIHALVRAKAGEANIASTSVLLPPSEQIDNAHIRNPCTRVQFDAGNCPKGSILGRAKAVSPLLDKPLTGPVYFRSNGGARELPDLVADLHGQIHVVLVGYIDAVNGRVRTRFAHVPDAPVSKFSLDLFGGKKGLVVNNRDICARRYRSKVRMRAHNGRALNTRPPIQAQCKGGHKK
ncbi:MAG: hypothetical protein ACTHN3_10075 [Solirubrobacterales bacterium]